MREEGVQQFILDTCNAAMNYTGLVVHPKQVVVPGLMIRRQGMYCFMHKFAEYEVPPPPRASATSPVCGLIVITAAAASAVRSAETRIALVVSDARDKLDYTHFVSVPLALDPSTGRRLKEMQDSLLADDTAGKVRVLWGGVGMHTNCTTSRAMLCTP